MLLEETIRAGERLLCLLKKHKFPFRAALWVYLTEAEEWRLFLAVPNVHKEGSKKFYKQVRIVREEYPDFRLPRFCLAIVDARDRLVYSYGPGIKVGDATGHTFSRGAINGREFDDAYVYPRITSAGP